MSSASFSSAEYAGQVAVTGDRAKLLQSVRSSPGNSYAEVVARQNESFDRFTRESHGLVDLRGERGGRISVSDTRSETDLSVLEIPIGRMMVESQKTAFAAQQQLADDVRSIERSNEITRERNALVRSILKDTTGRDLGDDREAWNRMWVDRQGYAYRSPSTSPRPTIDENVPLNYMPTPIPPSVVTTRVGTGESATASLPPPHSCFAAGTSVRTIDGDRSIESIRAGDLVLVQDTRTGGLGYQAVVTAYHNPPSPTLRVSLGGADAVVATGIHRFWKAGKGWTMARDLKAGDRVRTLGGVARVEAVEDDRTQPVFNLEVAEGHSFLVGKLGTLVHDNSLVEATPAPFDAGTPAVAVVKVAK